MFHILQKANVAIELVDDSGLVSVVKEDLEVMDSVRKLTANLPEQALRSFNLYFVCVLHVLDGARWVNCYRARPVWENALDVLNKVIRQ